MYGVSDAKDKHHATFIPDKADETDDSFISDTDGDWAATFDSLPVKIVAAVSTTSGGPTLALAQKQTKTLTLSDFELFDESVPSPVPSPERFHKNKNIRCLFPTARDTMNPDHQRSKKTSQSATTASSPDDTANSNTRYPLRSRAATTTGEPDGGCIP